jgi:PHD/YefM family antitoxin component YafN of YafNO toxin-antitoxin module
MNTPKQIKDAGASYTASVTDLSQPIILERDGQPVAALISIEEYERYQTLLEEQRKTLALEARRTADHAVFGDLVGCALSSGDPVWTPTPEPHWRVPYRGFDGTLLITVNVDANTLAVSLTSEERTALLEQLEQLTTDDNVPA